MGRASSKKLAILVAVILGFASEPAKARKFATQSAGCSQKARITEKAECQEATAELKDIKKPKTSMTFIHGTRHITQLYPNGMGTVGKGNIEEGNNKNYPDCSFSFDFHNKHFLFCPAGMKGSVNDITKKKNQAVCKAFCDETKPTCPMGESLRKDAATTRGSEAKECCESDSALQNLDTAAKLIECTKREKTYSGFVSCAANINRPQGEEEEEEEQEAYVEGSLAHADYSRTPYASEADVRAACSADDGCKGYWKQATSGHYFTFKSGSRKWKKGVPNGSVESVKVKTVANSRLYADNIPSLQPPSAVVPVFAASAAILAGVVAIVSFRRRRHVYHSEASMLDVSCAE